MKNEKPTGIQIKILKRLKEKEVCNEELSKILQKDYYYINKEINKMKIRKLIIENKSQYDARRKMLILTPKGCSTIMAIEIIERTPSLPEKITLMFGKLNKQIEEDMIKMHENLERDLDKIFFGRKQ